MTWTIGLFASLIAIFGGYAGSRAFAQTAPPDAGRILRETAPPPPPPPKTEPALPTLTPAQPSAPPAALGTTTFVLREVKFSGNTLFSNEELAEFVADLIGRRVGLSDLEAATQRITRHYRNAGYFLAQAIVPVQDVSNGSVELSIIEGRLGRVRINRAPEAPVSEIRIREFLDRLQPGKPLREKELERTMLLLSDLPGIRVQSALEAGDEPGTTDLVVDINARRPWDLVLDADNYGSRAAGEYRAGATGRFNSPLMLGDNLDLRVIFGSGGGIAYGRFAYEIPIGANGTRGTLALSRLKYDLGKDFAALDATGDADVVEAALTHPIIRSRGSNLFGRLSFEQKRLEDRIGVIRSESDKRIRNWVAGLAYERRDMLLGGGYTSAGITFVLGDLDIRSAADLAFDQSVVGRRSNGSYTKYVYQLSRLNFVTAQTNLFLGLTGQFANKNLDSAEKIALGGPQAVRAYPVSEGIVDEGQVLNVEYRYSLRPELTVLGFYDWGWGRASRDPLPGEPGNSVRLRGYGLGMFWAAPKGVLLRASVAWRDTGPPTSDSADRVPRLFLQISKAF